MGVPTDGNERDGNAAATVGGKPPRNVALWIVQVLLALLFVFSGVMKFVMPVAKMQEGGIKLPGLFLHFIGVAEMLGGLGLILPGLLGIRRGLTPLAAAGLLIIMVGATVVTLMGGGGATSLIPLAVSVLVAFVAHGRWNWLVRQ
ncbi:MAG TPA: DoxX family protein [Thermoanaerobaculia bacterium]|nr:DoxX family protein [Thermoanaerobaculia bacterium]